MKTLSNNANVSETAENEAIEKERLRLIKKYENCPKTVGRTQMLKFLNGEHLTPKQAIQAECFASSGGLRDCINFICPLFDISEYKDKDFVMDDERKERIKRLIKSYEANTITSVGNTQYLRYLKGEKLTYTQAMLAKCAVCECSHDDGRVDCEKSLCTLYRWMPYRVKQS